MYRKGQGLIAIMETFYDITMFGTQNKRTIVFGPD